MDNKYIAFFDLETTGLDKYRDFILQIAGKKIEKETGKVIDKFSFYVTPINPNYEISEGAIKVHGITKKIIEEKGITLESIFNQKLKKFFEGADIGTYNGNTFDIPFLINNLKMIPSIPVKEIDELFIGKQSIDVYLNETTIDGRNLGNVYKKYTGKELQGAHDAFNDIEATIEVYKNQKGDFKNRFPVLCTDNTIGYKDSVSDAIVLNIGKYRGQEVKEVAEKDRSYLTWYWKNVATPLAKYNLNLYFSKK